MLRFFRRDQDRAGNEKLRPAASKRVIVEFEIELVGTLSAAISCEKCFPQARSARHEKRRIDDRRASCIRGPDTADNHVLQGKPIRSLAINARFSGFREKVETIIGPISGPGGENSPV